MPITAEAYDVDIQDLKLLLESKLNPMQDAITRLEESNLKMVELLINQARQDEIIRNIQKESINNVIVHDELFKRLRTIEEESTCQSIDARVDNLEESNKDSKGKIWRIVELLIAGLIGGLINWGWDKK